MLIKAVGFVQILYSSCTPSREENVISSALMKIYYVVKSKLLKTDNNDDDTKDNENTLIWTN